MMRSATLVFGCLLGLAAIADVSAADLSRRLAYQGHLSDESGTPVSGIVSFTFSLYDTAVGGTSLWTEVRTVNVSGGLFSVQLGEVTPLPFDLLSTKATLYLGMRAGADGEMSPRQQIFKSTLTQVQGEEIAREAVWPVHEGRNNTIRSYHAEYIGTNAVSFAMNPAKTFIITDISCIGINLETTSCTYVLISHETGGSVVPVFRSRRCGHSGFPTYENLDVTLRSGIPIPAGSNLRVGGFGNNSPQTYCTVSGFEIPASGS